MEFNSRKMVMAPDLNATGTLFGGKVLSWVDEEAAIFVISEEKTNNIVTKFMSNVNFLHPAKLGDIVEIGIGLLEKGNTSISVKSEVRNLTTAEPIVTIDKIVFVNLDKRKWKKYLEQNHRR